MNKDNHTYFSLEDLSIYLEGKLTSVRKTEIDNSLENDTFLADALEGLKMIPDSSRRLSIIGGIEDKLQDNLGLKKKTRTIQINYTAVLSIAAILLFMVGSFFILNQYDLKSDKVAQVQKEVPAKDQAVNDGGGSAGVVPSEQSTPALLEDKKQEVKTELKEEADTKAGDNEVLKIDDETVGSTDKSAGSAVVVNVSPPPPPAAESADDYKSAMNAYNTHDYTNAASGFESILNTDPSNTEARFYAGLSYYNAGKMQKAISAFDKVIASGKGNYPDSGRWFKAQALIQKGDKQAAKVLLEEISRGSSKYKDNAVSLLKSY